MLINMHWYLKGVFLSLIFVISFVSLFSFSELHAAENDVTAKSIGFEKTTIIEFKNNDGSSNFDTIRMWLGADSSFKSFKTEKGWIGEKIPSGVIVFTTTEPLKPGEMVKFGIKTDKPKPGINWKVIDINEKQIGTGKTLVTDSVGVEPEESSKNGPGISDSSSFRLIPEKPNVGSSMRVTGDNFGANQKLDFYIGTKKIASFETDDNGHFMITSKVPEDQNPGRIDFVIKDSLKNEKSISLRIGDEGDRVTSEKEIPLTISATPPIVYRGDTVKVTGTGMPGSTVTATVKDPEGNVITTIAVDVDLKGNWIYEGVVAPDAPFGKQTAEITDGTNTIVRTWTVESSKVIEVNPSKIKYEPGDIIVFNGTALPNQELEILVEDPQGNEFHSDSLNVDASGIVSFEVPTEQSSNEGTYVIFLTQGDQTEIILIGLGELPVEQLIVKTDKLNYAAGSKVIIEIQGPASSTISLLIIDPSDKNKLSESITLLLDGSAQYELDLSGYGSGVYSVVLTRGNAQTSNIFSVGLQTGSGEINVRTTKDTYQRGESILILGSSGDNILLTLTLTDPDNNIEKTKETFTNSDGVFSENSFRIPKDAKIGTWSINAKSGPNFDTIEITVIGADEEGMVLFVKDIVPSAAGKIITFSGHGAVLSQWVTFEIFSDDGEVVVEGLRVLSTGVGEFQITWIVPKDFAPGKYTIKASDIKNEVETTFDLK